MNEFCFIFYRNYFCMSCVLLLLVIYDGDMVGWDSQNCTAVQQFLFALQSLIVVIAWALQKHLMCLFCLYNYYKYYYRSSDFFIKPIQSTKRFRLWFIDRLVNLPVDKHNKYTAARDSTSLKTVGAKNMHSSSGCAVTNRARVSRGFSSSEFGKSAPDLSCAGQNREFPTVYKGVEILFNTCGHNRPCL